MMPGCPSFFLLVCSLILTHSSSVFVAHLSSSVLTFCWGQAHTHLLGAGTHTCARALIYGVMHMHIHSPFTCAVRGWPRCRLFWRWCFGSCCCSEGVREEGRGTWRWGDKKVTDNMDGTLAAGSSRASLSLCVAVAVAVSVCACVFLCSEKGGNHLILPSLN